MASVRPKTTASGGTSPRGWISVFTLLLGMVGFYQLRGENLQPAHLEPKPVQAHGCQANLTYLIEQYQLTKEPHERTRVISARTQQ
jgi:hypothetical protein